MFKNTKSVRIWMNTGSKLALYIALMALSTVAPISGSAKAETKTLSEVLEDSAANNSHVTKVDESKAKSLSSKNFTAPQTEEINQLVHDFIMSHPEVLMDSVKKYQEDQEAKRQRDSIEILKQNKDFFYKNSELPQVGNTKGDITIIEFFDYNCGYCKHAYSTVQSLLASDKNISFKFVEFPILSAQSNTAAQWALAAHKQGKYWEFHQKVITMTAPKSEEELAKVAKEIGLDIEKMKKDAQSEEIKNLILKNREMAGKLSISGTPAFIVGNDIIRGFVDIDVFKSLIENERKTSK